MKKTLLVAALLAASGAAQALTVSGGAFGFGLEKTEISQTGTLNLFDTNWGTLTGVELNIFGEGNTRITLKNNASQTQRVSATGSLFLDFSSSIAGLDALLVANNPLITMTFPAGLQSLTPGQSFVSPVLAATHTVSLNNELNGILGQFGAAGGGGFTLSCTSLSGISLVGGGGNVASEQVTNAGCGAEISYIYDVKTQVPEPASVALLGLGLLGMGALRRRKSA